MNKSESITELAKALCKVQGELKNPVRDTKAYNYKYSDLAGVWDALRSLLSKNGLSVFQSPYERDGTIGVITMLMHESGEWLLSEFGSKPSKSDPQAVGSLITYYRRYALMAVTGIAPEDDDGQSAMPVHNSQPIKSTKHTVLWGVIAGLTDGFKDTDSLADIYKKIGVSAGHDITQETDSKKLQSWIDALRGL